MKNFSFLNNVTGWVVFGIAAVCYLMTIEPTASFWDCGEFIASANGLEVGHPPGAPLWMLISRVFIMFAGEGSQAMAVNVESALVSAFTILFLFWSISHLARKLLPEKEFDSGRNIAILGSAAAGALAYAFTDSFWFSAVEGEVYALSSLFTALVFWAILKWESLAHKGAEMRWILLIAYLMGLSIGVHLLNLLAIPAITLVYYFKRYDFSWKGVVTALLISGGLVLLVLVGVIQGLINMAAQFELLFVNDFGMGFNSGVFIYGLLVLGLLATLIVISRKRKLVLLNTLSLSVLVIVIGYSTFAMIVVRSVANPPMDENNPENLFTLLSYLNREQYGDRPLMYGHFWNTPLEDRDTYQNGDPTYFKSYSVYRTSKKGDKLAQTFRDEFAAEKFIAGKSEKTRSRYFLKKEYLDSREKAGAVPNYVSDYEGLLPRMYSSQANHVEEYKSWSNYKGWNDPRKREKVEAREAQLDQLESDIRRLEASLDYYRDQISPEQRQEGERQLQVNKRKRDKLRVQLQPSGGENMRYFFQYQMDWMYWRYFMWNFAGRQNDQQGHGDIVDGNWLSGVSFIDEQRLGNRERIPEQAEANKGYNKYFLIPLIFGLIGLVFQAIRAPKDFVVVGLLFLLTGAAIVVYLNQYPYQPRERDYAYVGSFYAFALWIGLGVTALYYISQKVKIKDLGVAIGMSLGAGVIILIMEFLTGSSDQAFSYTLLYMALVAAVLMAASWLLGKAGVNGKGLAAIATVFGLAVPIILAAEGWDDHSRANRRTGVDFAKNYLDSVEPNAILFTNGDNDTFPLWYVQEVEGYRTDVRVVNLSLLNTDWYVDQMKRKAYNSDPVPFSIPEQKYRQGTRDVIYLPAVNPEDPESIKLTDMSESLDYALDDKNRIPGQSKALYELKSKRLSIPIDKDQILRTGTVDYERADQIVDSIRWEIPGNYITKNSMMVLDMIRTNNWERPIYFAVTTGRDAYIGLSRYFQLEGLAYRFVPVRTEQPHPLYEGQINADAMYENVINEFQWGNMDDSSGIYMDENNLRMVTNLRLQMANLAEELIQRGDGKRAKDVMDLGLAVMPEKSVPYDQVMFQFVKNYYEMAVDTSLVPFAPDSTMTADDIKDARKSGEKVLTRLFDIHEDEMYYYQTLDPQHALSYRSDMRLNMELNQNMVDVLRFYDPQNALIESLEQRLTELQSVFDDKDEEIQRQGRRSGTPGEF